jgi:hypothetical protein
MTDSESVQREESFFNEKREYLAPFLSCGTHLTPSTPQYLEEVMSTTDFFEYFESKKRKKLNGVTTMRKKRLRLSQQKKGVARTEKKNVSEINVTMDQNDRIEEFPENYYLLWSGSHPAGSLAFLNGGVASHLAAGVFGMAYYFSDAFSRFCYSNTFWSFPRRSDHKLQNDSQDISLQQNSHHTPHTTPHHKTRGIMFLSQIQMGCVFETKDANNEMTMNTLFELGGHSVMGRGILTPSTVSSTKLQIENENVHIPNGKVIRSGIGSALTVNEFVIFCPKQIQTKYLVYLELSGVLEKEGDGNAESK